VNWFQRERNGGFFKLRDHEVEEDPFVTLEAQPHENRLNKVAPYLLAGMTLLVGFGFMGQYLSQDAAALGAAPTAWEDIGLVPRSVVAKSSLLRMQTLDPDKAGFPLVGDQASTNRGKSDFDVTLASLPQHDERVQSSDTLIFSPSIATLERRYDEAQTKKRKLLSMRKEQAAEESCLAVAIYFEARSESEMGQKAIAKVILNRTKNPNFPNTICGVVYQNADRRSGCQFSFACDGIPDEPKSGPAWARAKEIARLAMEGDMGIAEIKGATHYHADYVNPGWSNMLKRLGKIGRHIFYSKG